MEPRNRGHQLLLEKTSTWGQKKVVAEKVGVELNQISQWTVGDITPSGPNRTKLEDIGIPSRAWDEPVEPTESGAAQ